MTSDVRSRMIEGAARLLAQNGLQGTSFSEVLELTGAPRGSVYHHFPGGKDQLVGSAIELAGAHAIALLERSDARDPAELTAYFLGMWRSILERSSFSAGCSVLAVTVATDSPDLLAGAGQVFRAWRGRLAELFAAQGVDEASARGFSAILVAGSEGAVVLSRGEQSFEPFDLVAGQLLGQAAALPRS